MVNENFKRELGRLLQGALEEVQVSSSNPWVIRENNDEKYQGMAEIFMLTISSQLFRIVLVMHFSRTSEFEEVVINALKLNANSLDQHKFFDFVGEVGNSICGAIKRELTRTVPSMGMSTPNRLSRDCLKYVKTRSIDYQSHRDVILDDQRLFAVSLYLFADHDLNYEVKDVVGSEDDVASGELEFF
jgi:hypothetical protein